MTQNLNNRQVKKKSPCVFFITGIILLLRIKLRVSHMLSKCLITSGTSTPLSGPSFSPPPPLLSSFLFPPSFVTFPYCPLSFLSFVHPWFWTKVPRKIWWMKYVCVRLVFLSPSRPLSLSVTYFNVFPNGSVWDRAIKSVFTQQQVQLTCFSSLEGCDMERLRLGHMVHAGLCFCEWRQKSSSACLSWGNAEEISCLIHG